MYSTKQTAILELFSGAYILFVHILSALCLTLACVFGVLEKISKVMWYTGQTIGLDLKRYLESCREPHARTTHTVNQSRPVLENQELGGCRRIHPKSLRIAYKVGGVAKHALPKKRIHDTDLNIGGSEWRN